MKLHKRNASYYAAAAAAVLYDETAPAAEQNDTQKPELPMFSAKSIKRKSGRKFCKRKTTEKREAFRGSSIQKHKHNQHNRDAEVA